MEFTDEQEEPNPFGPSAADVADGSGEAAGQRVSWAECFFDLVVALAVTEVAGQLQHAPSWPVLGRSLLLLVPFWWGWVGTALLFNGLRISPIRKHLLLFGIALGALLMSTAVPSAYGTRGALFGCAYLMVRILLGVPMRARDLFGFRLDPFTIALFVGGPLYLIGGFTPMPYRFWLWAVAAMVEIGSTVLRPRRFSHMHWEPAHLPERFGLFIIIVLGEAIATIGAQAATRTLTVAVVSAVILAFVLAVGLWWAYFTYAMPAIEFALRTSVVQTKVVRDVFSYGHLALAAGVLLTAAGSAELVAAPTAVPHGPQARLTGLGVALYILAFCYNRHKMFGGVGTLRAIAAALAAGGVLLGAQLPGLVTLAWNAAVLVAMHAVEGFRVETGRPMWLLPWPPHPPQQLKQPLQPQQLQQPHSQSQPQQPTETD
jgi:low temperature requirement protein LtrA